MDRIHLALPVLLLISPITLAADGFSQRVNRAKEVENSAAGHAYQQLLMSQIGQDMASIMRECFPETAHLDTVTFAVVADVRIDGVVTQAVVRPVTAMSSCFTSRFSALPLPVPPAEFMEGGMPLVIDMRVEP